MKRLLSALAVTLATVASGGATTAQEFIPPDCQNIPLPDTNCIVEHYTHSDGNEIYPLPASITHYACDVNGQAPAGAIDETADLQAWINSVPDGNGLPDAPASTDIPHVDDWHVMDFPDGRCIRMDGHLNVQGRHYLRFEGGGVTLDQRLKPSMGGWDPTGTFTLNGSGGWHVIRGSYLEWRSFKIIGGHPEKQLYFGGATSKSSTYGTCHLPDSDGSGHISSCEWQHPWAIAGGKHVTLDDNESRNTHGDSVFIGWHVMGVDYWTGDVVDSRYVTINNHRVYGAGRMGMAAMSGQDITISNSYIEGAAHHAIDLEPESSDNRFPIRRVTITNNEFGESHMSIGALGTGVCADVTDVTYTNNVQTAINFSWLPSVLAVFNPSECTHPVQRGPVTVTNNYFWVESGGGEDVAGWFRNNDNVTFSSNVVRRDCGGLGCTADPNSSALTLEGGSGHIVDRNDLAAPGSHAPFNWVYSYDGVYHGSSGPLDNVSSCGNTTAQGADQPNPCFPPLP
jgi:hypothetical protein